MMQQNKTHNHNHFWGAISTPIANYVYHIRMPPALFLGTSVPRQKAAGNLHKLLGTVATAQMYHKI